MSADKILFRPSSLGDLMTAGNAVTEKQLALIKIYEERTKPMTDKQAIEYNDLVRRRDNPELSLTCKRKLVKIYREIKYDRYYSHSNKYTEKGIKMEEDAITLYSRVKKLNMKKNTERLTNDWFTGEIDIRIPKVTIDTKCSWGLDTFPHPMLDEPDKGYIYQGDAYMDLDKADKHIIAYCLVNAPANLILRAKELLWYNFGCPAPGNPDYDEYMLGKIEIEKNMIFDMEQFNRDNKNFDLDCEDWIYDIPKEERVVEFVIERNEERLQSIKDRLTECRKWMNETLYKLGAAPLLLEEPTQ